MTSIDARARSSIGVLLVRQGLLHVLTFSGGVVLARALLPAQFGLFAIASFVVGLFGLVADTGIAASFIQRRTDPTQRDLRVAFTLQQILTLLVVGALMATAPSIAALYPHAPRGTDWLIRALAASLCLASWRSMSTLQLERHLTFHRLAWIEVVEALSYQATAVTLALLGLGVWSLVIAVLLRGLLGAVLVYAVAPWPIGFAFDAALAGEILRFGIPFQLQTVANDVGNWVTPTLVAGLIGPQAVGYLEWGSSNGRKPLVLVDNVMRVAYPHLSRVQDDRAAVERSIIRYLSTLLLPGLLWTVLLAVAGPDLVAMIYTARWVPAIPALVLFAMGLAVDSAGWVIGISLNALGRVGYTTRVVMARSLTTVLLALALVPLMGFVGVAVAYVVASALTFPWLLRGLGGVMARRILAEVSWTLVPAAVSASLGLLTLHLTGRGPVPTTLTCVVVVGAFGAASLALCPRWLRSGLWRPIRRGLLHRRPEVAATTADLQATRSAPPPPLR